MLKYRYWFKYLLLVVFGLSIIVSQPSFILAQEVNKATQQQKQAQLLTQKGYEQLSQGQPVSALETWGGSSEAVMRGKIAGNYCYIYA